MSMFIHLAVGAAIATTLATPAALAQTVGVSCSNFQEERWKTDEKAIKDQLANIDGLVAKGAKALVILAMDQDAIVPALAKAKEAS